MNRLKAYLTAWRAWRRQRPTVPTFPSHPAPGYWSLVWAFWEQDYSLWRIQRPSWKDFK